MFLTRPQTPETITATCAWKDRVFAAWGGGQVGRRTGVWVFQRGTKVDQLEIFHDKSHEPLQKIFVFGAWIVGCGRNNIEVWKSASYEHYTTITPSISTDPVHGTLTGSICNMPTFLNKVFVGKRDGAVDVWNVSTGKLVYIVRPPSSLSGAVTALEPTTALSVLAIARENGSIDIHNIHTDQLLMRLNDAGSPLPPIISISFRTDGLGAGEDGREQGIMATVSEGSGDVSFWDLNKGGRVRGILRGAHNPGSSSSTLDIRGVNKVEFLPGQDVMITSGLDNALKSWIFDANSLSPIPRILHARCGHASPVTRLLFIPSSADGSDTVGKWLMSAGRDQSLWAWSLRRDGQSGELSQGGVQKKAKKLGLLGSKIDSMEKASLDELKTPEIISMACVLNRDGGMGASAGGGAVWSNTSNRKGPTDASDSNTTGWESVVTGHRGDKFARTWYWGRKRAGRWAFETGDGSEVTTVAITACGTFALVGSTGGSITMFNLQSGLQRQKFPSAITPAQARKLRLDSVAASSVAWSDADGVNKYRMGHGKHNKAVTGLMVDSLNKTVISCGLDGKIKFWDFTTGYLKDEIEWFPTTAIIASQYHRQSDLLALSCDDLSIRIVDTETKKTVRELWGCLGQISDFCFSNDGRWIVAASVDSVIRVWDLPTGHLINALRMESPCTSLAFSDTGEFLATAHADSVGINIWNNRTLFTHVANRPLDEDEVIPAIAPTTSGESGEGLIDAAFEASDEEDGNPLYIEDQATLDDLDANMQSLSLVPKSRWQTLLHLDIIRQRNKPKEPPKPPEKAPFFLPSLEDGRPNSSAAEMTKGSEITAVEQSRIKKMDRSMTVSAFTTALTKATTTGQFAPLITHLSTLSPSAADIEIRSLNHEELVPFVQALTFGLRQRKDFELIQAWMTVFLRIHGETIGGSDEPEGLREALLVWRQEQEIESRRLGDLVGYCGGVIGFLRSGR